jgi:8-oxo-dGTP diphosphatase
MRVNKIVTSFLKHGDRILILRRSDKVSTYKGRWGGVSGFIEGDEKPFERAVKEIEEETGLKGNDLELLKEGRTFSFRDKDGEFETKWVVHPFLFRAKNREIRIDDEHFEFRWIKPEELPDYFTVPKLGKSLRKVIC